MNSRSLFFLNLVLLSSLASIALGNEPLKHWKAGFAKVKITPEEPIALVGYGRKGPFESVAEDIWAKALAVQDATGNRGVIVTTDLVGVHKFFLQAVRTRIQKSTGLDNNQILFNASHNHTGPLVSLKPGLSGNLARSSLTPEDVERTVAYTHKLQDHLVHVAVQAVERLAPAKFSWGQGHVDFPMNRRVLQNGKVHMRPNPEGQVDRSVPVLRIDSPKGKLRGILFGAACHNTTLTGKHKLIAGDYAGFAQAYLERKHPDVQAMFMSGCGADANPEPRGTMERARLHGANLAEEVDRVLEGSLMPIQGTLSTSASEVDLPLQQLSRPQIEAYTTISSTQALMAKHMLTVLDRGESLPTSFRVPLAVWQLGQDLTLVALPSEPVAEYVTLLGNVLGPKNLWVSGYNNDFFGYVPSARIVEEGGHEAIGVTLWIWGEDLFRNAGFFTSEVQPLLVKAVADLAAKVGRPDPQSN